MRSTITVWRGCCAVCSGGGGKGFVKLRAPHPFDLAHGTDTGGYIPGEELGTGSRSDLYNTAYYAIAPSTLRHALGLLPVGVAGFTFVDLGCGKGRALLVAEEFGFDRVVGVELSAKLQQIAVRNTMHSPRISVENVDASQVNYPSTPLVIFLYHPFLATVLERVLENLEEQLDRTPRETFLLIANPSYPRSWRRFPRFEVVWSYRFPLSEEDAGADRHFIRDERYTLRRARLRLP